LQQDNHPLLLNNLLSLIKIQAQEAKLKPRLILAPSQGFVEAPEHYLYSSARDYYTSKKGLIDIVILESLVR
jgi:hypothetical protein